jgi:uncharacterized protein (TIGR03083 family)
MSSATPEDRALVDQLEHVWRSIDALGAELSEDEWKTATAVPGWSVQDNLAHVTDIEARLLGRPAPDHALPDDIPHAKNDFGRANELFVDSRRSWAGADVHAEFREVTAARLAQMHEDTYDFAAESFTPVGPGTIRDLLPFRVFDAWVHEQDMRDAVGRPGHREGPVAQIAFERTVAPMPFVVGKKAGAPEGATVVFSLSGPLARDVAIGVEGGRARLLDTVPASPTAEIVTDTQTFERVATGRLAPGDGLTAGRITLRGDTALARRVVEEMNFLF